MRTSRRTTTAPSTAPRSRRSASTTRTSGASPTRTCSTSPSTSSTARTPRGALAAPPTAQSARAPAAEKPFFAHVMTTSNHRPYTYPDGRIDIASGTSREGAVKYTDYALGKFLQDARGRPWFDNTVFVITADHGANARGTSRIPVDKYLIPLFVYAPKHVPAGRVDRLMSQIDIPPTVLGLLDFRYYTKFFGRDVLRSPRETDRA